jgi:hypothetical protein
MQWGGKYYKEYDKLGCDLVDMWRRPARTGIGLQTHQNCCDCMGDIAHKTNSEFSSSPVQNPEVSHIKTHVQVTYNIQSGRSWTRWKDKEIMSPMGPVSYPTKI